MDVNNDSDGYNVPFPGHIGDLYVKKQRSTKSRPSSSKSASSKTTPLSTKIQILQPLDTSQVDAFMTSTGHSPILVTTPRSSSNESYLTCKTPNNGQKLRHTPSEAARLRKLDNGHSPVTPTGRSTYSTPYAENFSRPRKISVKAKEDLMKPPLHPSSTFSTHSPAESSRNSDSIPSRDRGLSVGSWRSANTTHSTPLRPTTAISEPAFDPTLSKSRHFTGNSTYSASSDLHLSNHYREPKIRTNGMDEDAVRASFRSALTAASSFIGTSGTERSSVMTKSSSATSLYGREEGMSVDDAIGMYEAGFDDSDPEEEYISRPGSALSYKSGLTMPSAPKSNSPPVPTFSNLIIRDSTAIFGSAGGTEQRKISPPLSEPDVARRPFHYPHDHQSFAGGNDKPPSPPDSPANLIPSDGTRDRYGFRKQTQHVSLAEYDAWHGPYVLHLDRRKKKWVAMMTEAGFSSDNPVSFPAKSTKIKRFVRKGIPPEWRGAAWFWYAGGPEMVAKHPGVYEWLVQQAARGDVDVTDEELIERDLNRTFPDNVKFKPDPIIPARHEEFEQETPILKSLRRVLQAFSIYNPKIGYCQSLNFLAGLLLLFMEEEKSFWLLNIITREYLPGTHEVNLEGANVDLGVLMISIKESMPPIWAKIGGELDGSAGPDKISMRLPPITLCCTAWFMSCFIGTLPIETTLRVWDSFFYEGSKTFFRIALAIFKVGEAEIRAVNDPMEVFQVVQTIPRRLVDANALMEACFKRRNGFGHLSQETIEARRKERRDAYAEERARAAGKGPMARKNTIFSRRKAKPAEDPKEKG